MREESLTASGKKAAERKPAPKQNTPAPNKKRAGRKPCSENCVDPIFPKIGFDLD
jgi:hypothetical protein